MTLADQLALDVEEVVLGVIEQHEQPRAHARDLPAQLGADRAAGAGHEHDAVAQVGARLLDLDRHGLAPEHVLDLHLAHLAHQVDGAGDQLEHARAACAPGCRAHGTRARPARAARRARTGSR